MERRATWSIGLAVVLAFAATGAARAQDTSAGGWAWKPVVQHHGLEVSYIFYPEGDGRNDGVVIKLYNANSYRVRFRFDIVFRSASDQVTEQVEGTLEAGEVRTGDRDGLFFIPFPDGTTVAELGLRRYQVERAVDAPGG